MTLATADSTGSGAELIREAREIASEITSRSAEIESAGTLPGDLVDRLRDAGLFSMALPPELGGGGASAATIVSVVEEISRADAAAGWSVLIGQSSGFLGWLDPAAGAQIVAKTPRPLVAGSMAPTGSATATAHDPGASPAYDLSGRWSFNSGCRHADWILVAFFLRDGQGPPRMSPSGQPMMRFGLVPATEARILDTWKVMGLRGTGSEDLAIEGARLTHDWTFDPFFEPPTHDGQLYRLSFYSFLMTMMAGFPLGVARRALDEFSRSAQRRSRLGTRHSLAEDPMVQVRYLRAANSLRAARLLVFDAIEQAWDEAATGTPSPQVRARLAGAVQHAQRVCTEVVEWVLHTSGGSAIYDSSPLQRCWRDINAAGQHIAFGAETERRMARVELGVEEHLLHLV
jgi:alkylation response protein AidB-like acyl-CoA dehydrogenase